MCLYLVWSEFGDENVTLFCLFPKTRISSLICTYMSLRTFVPFSQNNLFQSKTLKPLFYRVKLVKSEDPTWIFLWVQFNHDKNNIQPNY